MLRLSAVVPIDSAARMKQYINSAVWRINHRRETMKHDWRAVLVAAALMLPFGVSAVAAPVGDPVAGEIKANTCMGCHGIPGYNNPYPTYHVPKLGGQHATYIINALHEYRSGNRQHPTMHAQASSLSDQDIADIAAFLSQAQEK